MTNGVASVRRPSAQETQRVHCRVGLVGDTWHPCFVSREQYPEQPLWAEDLGTLGPAPSLSIGTKCAPLCMVSVPFQALTGSSESSEVGQFVSSHRLEAYWLLFLLFLLQGESGLSQSSLFVQIPFIILGPTNIFWSQITQPKRPSYALSLRRSSSSQKSERQHVVEREFWDQTAQVQILAPPLMTELCDLG